MSKRGSWGSMQDRIAATNERAARTATHQPADTSTTAAEPVPASVPEPVQVGAGLGAPVVGPTSTGPGPAHERPEHPEGPPAGAHPPARERAPGSGPGPAEVKHCWVHEGGYRAPGLLLGWRHNTVTGWQGRVVRPSPGPGGWYVVEEWLPADALEPRDDQAT